MGGSSESASYLIRHSQRAGNPTLFIAREAEKQTLLRGEPPPSWLTIFDRAFSDAQKSATFGTMH
jgi:hypothetical protein